MKKVIMYGPNTYTIPNTTEWTSILPNEINQYLNDIHAPTELFIHAHGNENSPSQLSLDLFNDASENLTHNILSKISKKTIGNQPNIVHILSCHSGAAQHTLKDVEGNIVLCTYTKSENILRGITTNSVFNKETNLINFIVKNLPLLIATDFTISYKLDNNIHTLAFDHTSIKKMNLVTFLEFLQVQYNNVITFYKELQQQYSNEYQELIPKYDFSETISYLPEELKKAFNIVLNADYRNLTKSEIEHLLKMDNSYVNTILNDAIEKYDLDSIELILDNIEVDNSLLPLVIMACNNLPSNQNIQVFKMLFEKMKDISDIFLLSTAINAENVPVFEYLLNKMEIKNLTVIQAIKKGNPDIVKMLFDKIDVVDPSVLDEVNILGSPVIFRLVLDKMEKSGNLVLSNILKTANLFFIKLALDKMEKVDLSDVVEAIKLDDQNIFKLVLDKMINPSCNRDITPMDEVVCDQMVKIINSSFNYNAISEVLEKMVKTNNLHWAMKTIAKVLTGEEKATDAHAAIAIETGNPTIVEAVIEKTGVTYDLLKIASTTENQEIIDLVFNKFGTIPEWLLFDSISSMDDQSFTELLLNKMPQVSITAAYYALKVGNLEVIPEILKKVDINYDRNGDKEFCREIANEFSTEQNQEVTKQLEQYLVTLPEFNITNQLESKVISIIGDYLF